MSLGKVAFIAALIFAAWMVVIWLLLPYLGWVKA